MCSEMPHHEALRGTKQRTEALPTQTLPSCQLHNTPQSAMENVRQDRRNTVVFAPTRRVCQRPVASCNMPCPGSARSGTVTATAAPRTLGPRRPDTQNTPHPHQTCAHDGCPEASCAFHRAALCPSFLRGHGSPVRVVLHRTRTASAPWHLFCGQTSVNHPKMHPPKQPIETEKS